MTYMRESFLQYNFWFVKFLHCACIFIPTPHYSLWSFFFSHFFFLIISYKVLENKGMKAKREEWTIHVFIFYISVFCSLYAFYLALSCVCVRLYVCACMCVYMGVFDQYTFVYLFILNFSFRKVLLPLWDHFWFL